MKFSESWLRTWVNPSLNSEELAHLLTMAGLEVEEQEPVAPAFNQVVVAEVLSKEKHPDADRLNLLKVDVGQAAPLDIVCGAGNVQVGMKAPCALVGARLPGIEIKQAKVRGVASFGMMCSAKELGLAEESSGLLELPSDAPVGQDIRTYLDLNDHLLTLKLTPNRCDCLSLQGIAREVGALTGAPVLSIPASDIAIGGDNARAVTVQAADACPRYAGRVLTGVNARAITPSWMVQRLERCGLRSISALVDVTNYVLLELGQPLHAFDQDKLQGDIAVRFAREGETITLLNEQVLELQSDMLVIADQSGPVALAGIMGGADSAVSLETTSVFLESAFFAPSAITGKSRCIGFGSDSSYRFERGVDFAATLKALDRATQLIIEICGGVAGPVTEVIGELPARPQVSLRAARAQRVLGIALDADAIADILTRTGMVFEREQDVFKVTPPSYRFDISIEEDLIEELARVHGYDHIPPARVRAFTPMIAQDESRRSLVNIKKIMVLREYHETINYAFVDAEWERDLCGNNTPVLLQNPIASQMSVMRSSLLGGLLNSLRGNLSRRQPRVRLFETGGCFSQTEGRYVQQERLGGLIYGSAVAEQWGSSQRNVDFYDAKADVEALFYPARLNFIAATHTASHPGRSAQIMLDNKQVGWIGELHPQWQQKYELPLAPVWFELELNALCHTALPQGVEPSRFPPVRRDVAVLVDDSVEVGTLMEAMQMANAPHLLEVAVFDVYRGKGVENGKKSLAFRVLLQDTQKTLTDAEIDQSIARLLEALRVKGAQLRV